jgi:hypothetical protein
MEGITTETMNPFPERYAFNSRFAQPGDVIRIQRGLIVNLENHITVF